MKDDLTKWKPEPGKPITMGDIYCHGGDWAECCRRAEFLKPPPIEEDPGLIGEQIREAQNRAVNQILDAVCCCAEKCRW